MTPGAEHPNATILRNLYGALASGDLTTYLEGLADDVVFHIGGDSVVAGEYRGKAAVVELGVKVIDETGGTYRNDLLTVLANDSYVVTFHHWSSERRGQTIEMDNFNVYRLENGLVVERWEFVEDQARHDAFWAR